MASNDVEDLFQRRSLRPARAIEEHLEMLEEPGVSEAAAADDHPVAARRVEHAEGVGSLPDVSVSDDGDGDEILELGDVVPARAAGVALRDRSSVHSYVGAALVLGDLARVAEGEAIVVEPEAHLDGDRLGIGGPYSRADHAPAELGPGRDGRPAALAHDLGNGTAKVDVDVVHTVADALYGLGEDFGFRPEDLQRTRGFVLAKVRQVPGLLATLDDAACADHLRDAKTGPELVADLAVGIARDSGHRRQDDRRPDLDLGPDLQGRVGASLLGNVEGAHEPNIPSAAPGRKGESGERAIGPWTLGIYGIVRAFGLQSRSAARSFVGIRRVRFQVRPMRRRQEIPSCVAREPFLAGFRWRVVRR